MTQFIRAFGFTFLCTFAGISSSVACDFDLEENISVLDQGRYSPVLAGLTKELKQKKKYDFVSRQAFQKAKRTVFLTYSQPNSFEPGYLETLIVEFKNGTPKPLFQRKIELDSPLENSNSRLQLLMDEMPSCPLVESGQLNPAPIKIVAN